MGQDVDGMITVYEREGRNVDHRGRRRGEKGPKVEAKKVSLQKRTWQQSKDKRNGSALVYYLATGGARQGHLVQQL